MYKVSQSYGSYVIIVCRSNLVWTAAFRCSFSVGPRILCAAPDVPSPRADDAHEATWSQDDCHKGVVDVLRTAASAYRDLAAD